MRIHVIGVAGTGMGALAGLLVELGHTVSGSDTAFYPPIGPLLSTWGVTCREGFARENLDSDLDLVVVGNVCRPSNAEARAAIDGGMPYTHIAGALARFVLAETRPLVVAGTHGKTTTASLCAWLLDHAGQRPGFLIGGVPRSFEHGFRAARAGAPFVIEGDEYDTAFFEKTAKFLHYGADVAIVTSIEHDHVDIYPTFDSYLAAFRGFVGKLPETGLLVVNAADDHAVELAKRAPCRVVYYALEGEKLSSALPSGAALWTAHATRTDEHGTLFQLHVPGSAECTVQSSLIGAHNLRNALAALAAAHVGYGADLIQLCAGLARFGGVKRRQELLGRPGGVWVYDDFAHHPSAVAVTLDALRARHRTGKLIAVFEPRSATACRATHQAQYPLAFDAADEIIFAPLGREGLAPEERLDTEKVCADLRDRGKAARTEVSVDSIVERLSGRARAGDVIAVLSNGAFGGIHAKLIRALGEPAEAAGPQPFSS